MAAPTTPPFGFPSFRKGNHADDSCYIELTLKQAKINLRKSEKYAKSILKTSRHFANEK